MVSMFGTAGAEACLDYAVMSSGLVQGSSAQVWDDASWAPHRPVAVRIARRPRQHMADYQRVPRMIPFARRDAGEAWPGPANAAQATPSDDAERCAEELQEWQNYMCMRLESVLLRRCGDQLPEASHQAYCGRGRLPAFAMRPAVARVPGWAAEQVDDSFPARWSRVMGLRAARFPAEMAAGGGRAQAPTSEE